MKVLAVTSENHMELTYSERPSLSKEYAIVKVAYCGVCGSDLPRYFQGKVHQFPQVLAHEFSGKVFEIQENRDYKVGDKVVVAPLIPCDECKECKTGNPAMCTQYDFIGSRSQGAFAEYIKVPIKNLVKIPESMSLKHAALVEPLTVGIHGVDRANVKLGETTMIMGAGTIGLLTLLALKEKGVGEIIVVDINDKKLEIAKKIGCTHTINPLNMKLEDFFEAHDLPSLVYETAGSSVTQVQSIDFCAKKGQVVYIGTCTKDVVFKPEVFEKILRNELVITGSWMSYSSPFPGYEWPTAINMIHKQTEKFSILISSVHDLEDLDEPFKKMVEPNNDVVKVLYELDKD